MKLVWLVMVRIRVQPNFELKMKVNWGTIPEIIIKKGIGEKNMVSKTEIRAFLHDAKAVSPAIATLILIVIAAVAAAGVGVVSINILQCVSYLVLTNKTHSSSPFF